MTQPRAPSDTLVDSRGRRNARWLLATVFLVLGVGHFVRPDLFMRIMPPYVPWHYELVLISGFFEIAGGVGLLIPNVRRLAGWGLLALLLAVFPANVHMAVNSAEFADIGPAWGFWARLPFQPVLMWWVWRTALARPRPASD